MKLFEDSGYKLRTGFVGTPLLCNVLSDNGMDELAYSLLLNEEYPGWLGEVKLGATTVWERWNSLLPDGSISGINMNSLNHYAYGSIAEWMFRHSAGIQPVDSAPGFRKVMFIPTLNWKLRSMEGRYDSPCGLYESCWEIVDETHVSLSVTVPFGCSAALRLPKAKEDTYTDKENPMVDDVRDGLCHLRAGVYHVAYETEEPLRIRYSTDMPVRLLMEDEEVRKRFPDGSIFDEIPNQYRSYSMREIREKFDGRLTEEQLDEIDRILAKI